MPLGLRSSSSRAILALAVAFLVVPPTHAGALEVANGVNAGGAAYTTSSGFTFAGDAEVGAVGSFQGGRSVPIAGPVSGTDDPVLYETVRTGGNVTFVADGVIDGVYDVTLHLVEPNQAAGDRLFDVTVEGELVLDDYDIAAAANGPLVAHDVVVQGAVADGQLVVSMTGVVGRAIVAAVTVHRVADLPPAALTISPETLGLGAVSVGETASGVVTVSNGTAEPVEILSGTVSDGSFSLDTPLPLEIIPGEAVPLTITFSPSIEGSHAATLTLETSSDAAPQLMVSLDGVGLAQGGTPDIDVAVTAVDFGLFDIGVPTTHDLEIVNLGDGDLVLDSVSSTDVAVAVGGEFPIVVPALGSAVVPITIEALAAGEVASELVVASSDPDEPSVTVAVRGVARPFAVGSVAVIGCSNTEQHVEGYLDASLDDQLAAVLDLGGGALDAWFTNSRGHWDIYEAHRPVDGYAAAWVQICLRSSDLVNDNEAHLTAVIGEIALRDGPIPIFVSPINSYAEGHVCQATGADGPAAAAALADWATAELGLHRGPDTGPLDATLLARDGCHLNKSGIELVGAQLTAFFDPAG